MPAKPNTADATEAEIDALVAAFFACFDNRTHTPDLWALRPLFLADARIFKASDTGIDTMTVEAFIAPRQALFDTGALVDFFEEETTSQTQIDHGLATRLCWYRKSGLMHGAVADGVGCKTFQIMKTDDGWKIASITWRDTPATRQEAQK
ncbi:MAG: DUF4440 domain-containing protein [Alphaproteobacteria bacterium]|nr:DUF4440 domain-containing protein [Alphaproteobacteria bacterium]